MEESYPVSWSGLAIEPNIPEHAELDLSERLPESLSHTSPIPTYHNTFPRSRRRPASPLHTSASAPALAGPRSDIRATSPHAGGTSSPQPRYYPSDIFPTSFGYSSASSMPSTPSSFRSRSPSISSLETIEDSPDAEEAARLAAEEDAKYRAEMGEAGIEPGDSRRRSSLDGRASSLRSNKERKRWSVCGAERRADFSLEPIEEWAALRAGRSTQESAATYETKEGTKAQSSASTTFFAQHATQQCFSTLSARRQAGRNGVGHDEHDTAKQVFKHGQNSTNRGLRWRQVYFDIDFWWDTLDSIFYSRTNIGWHSFCHALFVGEKDNHVCFNGLFLRFSTSWPAPIHSLRRNYAPKQILQWVSLSQANFHKTEKNMVDWQLTAPFAIYILLE